MANGDISKAVTDAMSEDDGALQAEMDKVLAASQSDLDQGPPVPRQQLDQPEAPEGSQPDEAAISGETESAETPQGTADEVPTEYFGLDLSDLSAEKRGEIITAFKEQDKFIGKLLQEQAEEPAPAVSQPAPVEEEAPYEYSDADVASALGIDLEDPYGAEQAKVAVPLARQLMEQKRTLDQLVQDQEVRETERIWEGGLDRLEAQYGKLPVERTRVFEMAVDEGIATPEDAYWRVAGPARASLVERIQAARAEQLRDGKRAATGTRPRSSAPVTPASLKARDVKNGVWEGAAAAAAELGISWDEATKQQ